VVREEQKDRIIKALEEGLRKHEPDAICWCYKEAVDLVKKLLKDEK